MKGHPGFLGRHCLKPYNKVIGRGRRNSELVKTCIASGPFRAHHAHNHVAFVAGPDTGKWLIMPVTEMPISKLLLYANVSHLYVIIMIWCLEINSHEVNSNQINSHKINSYEINCARDQLPRDQLSDYDVDSTNTITVLCGILWHLGIHSS